MPRVNNPENPRSAGGFLARLDALEKQVRDLKAVNPSKLSPLAIVANAANYAMAAADTIVAQATVSVPDGYSRATLQLILSANYASPNTGLTEYATSYGSYSASNGQSGRSGNYDTAIADGGINSNSVGLSAVLEGLDAGDTITIAAHVWCGSPNVTPNAFNLTTIGGSLIFLR
ncbi:MAG TPA: hypothetical protein VGC45_15800 [Gryllotalpicola sp.]